MISVRIATKLQNCTVQEEGIFNSRQWTLMEGGVCRTIQFFSILTFLKFCVSQFLRFSNSAFLKFCDLRHLDDNLVGQLTKLKWSSTVSCWTSRSPQLWRKKSSQRSCPTFLCQYQPKKTRWLGKGAKKPPRARQVHLQSFLISLWVRTNAIFFLQVEESF